MTIHYNYNNVYLLIYDLDSSFVIIVLHIEFMTLKLIYAVLLIIVNYSI